MLSTFPEEKLDPRVKRTRQLLEQAFMEALDEKGFQAVSVQDITDRAGVNRATFYAHFEDKYALLDHSVRQAFRAEIEKRTLDVCHYTPDNLLNLIIAVCEFIGNISAHCTPVQPQFEIAGRDADPRTDPCAAHEVDRAGGTAVRREDFRHRCNLGALRTGLPVGA